MGTRARPRLVWVLLTTVAAMVATALVAPAANADPDPPQFCTLNISTGSFTCSATDPSTLGRLSRPAADGGGSYLLGRFYDDANLDSSDGYFNVTAVAPCDTNPDLDFTVAVMPVGWNDRVSSFQGFNNCTVKLWKNGAATGASYGPTTVGEQLGSMDNQTSSMTFY
jgi:hypothetical protein